MTDTRDEVVARMREFMKTSHSETEYRLLLQEWLNLIITLSAQLAEARARIKELEGTLNRMPIGDCNNGMS